MSGATFTFALYCPGSTATPTPTISVTASPTVTPSKSVTATVTPTASVTNTPTISVTPTSTPQPDVSPTPTSSVTPSITETVTPTSTITPSISETPAVTNSVTPSNTPTNTATISLTPTNTPTPSITETPTLTPTISITPTNTATVTPSVTVTATNTVTPTASLTPTVTPSSASLITIYWENNVGDLTDCGYLRIYKNGILIVDAPSTLISQGSFTAYPSDSITTSVLTCYSSSPIRTVYYSAKQDTTCIDQLVMTSNGFPGFNNEPLYNVENCGGGGIFVSDNPQVGFVYFITLNASTEIPVSPTPTPTSAVVCTRWSARNPAFTGFGKLVPYQRCPDGVTTFELVSPRETIEFCSTQTSFAQAGIIFTNLGPCELTPLCSVTLYLKMNYSETTIDVTIWEDQNLITPAYAPTDISIVFKYVTNYKTVENENIVLTTGSHETLAFLLLEPDETIYFTEITDYFPTSSNGYCIENVDNISVTPTPTPTVTITKTPNVTQSVTPSRTRLVSPSPTPSPQCIQIWLSSYVDSETNDIVFELWLDANLTQPMFAPCDIAVDYGYFGWNGGSGFNTTTFGQGSTSTTGGTFGVFGEAVESWYVDQVTPSKCNGYCIQDYIYITGQ